MRLALLPALLCCLPACIFLEDRDGAGADAGFPWVDEGWRPRIVTAGWSFGECVGRCRTQLSFDDHGVELWFRSNDDDLPDLVNFGTIGPDTIEEIDALAEDVVALRPARTYGCPDCDDGGAARLAYTATDDISVTEWEYGDPPPELAAVAAVLFDDLIRALTDCVETERVTLTSCSSPL